MGEKRLGNTFTDEELNPNRPHNYRKKYGKSPIGSIKEILSHKTPEELEAIEKKRRETRERNKSMKKLTEEILARTVKLNEVEKSAFLTDLRRSEKITLQEAIIYSQISKAIAERDTTAAQFVRDTSGQKPKDEVEHTVSIDNLLKNNGVFDEEDDEK